MKKTINQFFGDSAQKIILTTPAKNVKLPLTKANKTFIKSLKDTANDSGAEAVGLASNQIWDKQHTPPPAVFIIKVEDGWKPFINPTIYGSGPKIKGEEGCLSLRGRKPKLKKRDKNVTITYFDEEGNEHTEKYTMFDARIIFHEYDHLLGKLI